MRLTALIIAALLPACAFGQVEMHAYPSLTSRWLLGGMQSGSGTAPTKGFDASLFNRPLTFTNSVTQSAGGVVFGGGWASAGTIYNISATDVLTVTGWLKTTNSGTIFSKWILDGAAGYSCEVRSGFNKLAFGMFNSNASAGRRRMGSTVLTDGVMRHFAVVKLAPNAASSIQLYVNGQLEGMTTLLDTDPGALANSDFRIANRGGTDFLLIGTLRDVMVFNRALTDAEIKKLYEEGLK